MRNEIESRLLKILRENIELEDYDGELAEDEDLLFWGINSITFIKIIVAVEKEFDIEFDEEDLDYNLFRQLDKLVNYVEGKLGGNK